MYITKWIKGAYFPYVSRPEELRNYCVSNFGNITMEQHYKIKGQNKTITFRKDRYNTGDKWIS